jgi:hypothetical protein
MLLARQLCFLEALCSMSIFFFLRMGQLVQRIETGELNPAPARGS